MEIFEFRQKLKALERKIFEIAWGPETPSRQLFHYTSQRGLEGILTSGVVWATDLTFMNDEQELSYGNRLGQELYSKRLEEHGGDVAEALRPYEPTLYALKDNFNIYAFCLTELGDDIDTWKNYAQAGQGYALGFDLANAKRNRILKVIYRGNEQEGVFQRIMDHALEFLETLSSDKLLVDSEEEFKKHWTATVNIIHKALAMGTLRFKSIDWEKEQEWRFVGMGEPKGYRTADGKKLPYQEFSLEEFIPFGSIFLGPCSRASIEVSNLLEPYPTVEIEKSSIDCSELDS